MTTIAGNEAEIDAQLAALDDERRQVALYGLSSAEEDRERSRIRREYERVSTLERIPDERAFTSTGQSYGSRWREWGADERAAWLRSGEVIVYLTRGEVTGRSRADGTRDGVSLLVIWASDIDGTLAG